MRIGISHQLRIVSIILFCIAVISSETTAQEPTVSIAVPVSGEMIIVHDQQSLILLDTNTGDHRYLVQNGVVRDAYFDHVGKRIAYQSQSSDISLYDIAIETVIEFNDTADEFQYVPIRPPDENTLLLRRYSFIDAARIRNEIVQFNLITQQFSSLGQVFITRELLPDSIPLPAGVSAAYLLRFNVQQNPVFDEWIIFEISAVDAAFVDNPADLAYASQLPAESVVNLVLLWNSLTDTYLSVGESVSLNNPLLATSNWHPGGRLFIVFEGNSLHFMEFDPSEPRVRRVDSISNRPDDALLGWLGVDTHLLYVDLERDTGESIYSIRQFIDDDMFSVEFFRLPASLSATQSDWFLSATLSEQYALSCLFDQALPTQLALGQHGRFVPSASSRDLRDDPFILFSTVLGQATAEAEFTIVDGPACSGGYRFWQIALDDSTVGWAAEAGRTDYFMEPTLPIVHTPTPVPTSTPEPTSTPSHQSPATRPSPRRTCPP